MSEGGGMPAENQQAPVVDQYDDPPRCLVAVQPMHGAVAIAVGSELRVLDRRTGALHVLLQPEWQGAACVRGVAFDPTGRFLAAGGDGKNFKVWSCNDWTCRQISNVPKKISAVAFSQGGSVVLAADKFGDVLVAAVMEAASADQEPQPWELLLGHYCSLITSLRVSSDGCYVATTDRDMKVRVSIMPADPMLGAHSIQSYCLGHSSFVTCSAFVRAGARELLLSGGGEGALRMWNPLDGSMLCTLQLDERAAQDGGPEPRSVLAVAGSPDGQHAVAVLDGREELCVISLDLAGGTMSQLGWQSLPGLRLPTDVCFDAAGTLWAAGGPPTTASRGAFLAQAALTSAGELIDASGSDALTADDRQKLEARDGTDDLEAAKERSHLPAYLRKRQVSHQERKAKKAKEQQQEQEREQEQGETVP